MAAIILAGYSWTLILFFYFVFIFLHGGTVDKLVKTCILKLEDKLTKYELAGHIADEKLVSNLTASQALWQCPHLIWPVSYFSSTS